LGYHNEELVLLSRYLGFGEEWVSITRVYATKCNALTQVENDFLRDNRKKDSKSLFYIFQVVHDNMFPRIAATTNSKQALDIL